MIPEGKATVTISMTAEQKKEFRILAAEKGITISAMVLEWFEEARKKSDKKSKK